MKLLLIDVVYIILPDIFFKFNKYIYLENVHFSHRLHGLKTSYYF